MAIGKNLPMLDARERVMGTIGYVLNVELPGMLVGRVLRSPHPHARVAGVDTSRAERVAGVFAVLSRNDLMNQNTIFPYFGPIIRDQPVVAMDKVRFVGDPVAAVAALDEDAAQEALELIDMEYEELPAVFDAEEALKPEAPVLHERFPKVSSGFADVILNVKEGTNLCNHFKLRKGDVEEGFREAELIFEDVYRSPPVQHVPLEPHVCLAQVDDGQITVWSGTQTPHTVRAQIAEVFQVPLSRVRIVVHTLGGGYGAKSYPKLEPLTAVLAWKARRPVKIVLARDEEFRTVSKHAAAIRLKTGVKRDGTLVARQSTCHFNAGAYADVSPRLIKNGGYGTAGPYRIPHVRVDSYAAYTNIVPAGAFRGYGVSQAAWAYESQMDVIADALGIDPVELRLKNVLRDGDTFATGETVHDMHLDELLRDAARAIEWAEGGGHGAEPAEGGGRKAEGIGGGARGRERAEEVGAVPCSALRPPPSALRRRGSPPPSALRRRGKAVTCAMKGTVTPSTSSATVKLNDDGSLNVLTSSVEMGQGAKTVLAQIAAEEAGLPIERVFISEPDTDFTPYDQQTTSSRTTFSMGSAVSMAVQDVKRQLAELAAEQLEVSREDVTAEDGRVSVTGAPDRSLSYAELIRKSRRGNLLGHGTFVTQGGLNPETGQGIAAVHWHHAAAGCEVEVDLETGKIDVLRFHANVFAGRAVNPRQCELQTEGSTMFGLGQALFEEMVYDDGQLNNPNLSDYMIPSFEDVPGRLSTSVLEAPGAGEIHGIGETSVPPTAPAIGNAVARAIGVRITDLPLTPEKVLRALKSEK